DGASGASGATTMRRRELIGGVAAAAIAWPLKAWAQQSTIHFALLIACMLVSGAADAADDTAPAWAALGGDGHVALIRHASAPGAVGDPVDYKLDDCATQRNLSEQGRAEARELGARFRMQKVKVGRVVSSQWCRCRQTAELMNIGPVEDAP